MACKRREHDVLTCPVIVSLSCCCLLCPPPSLVSCSSMLRTTQCVRGRVQVVAGLDEALLSMQSGGVRRVYIPGPLAFPKGLPSGPGRCV